MSFGCPPFLLSPTTPLLSRSPEDNCYHGPGIGFCPRVASLHGLSRRCPLSIECSVDALDASRVVSVHPYPIQPRRVVLMRPICALRTVPWRNRTCDPHWRIAFLLRGISIPLTAIITTNKSQPLLTHYTSIYPLASLVLTDHQRDIYFVHATSACFKMTPGRGQNLFFISITHITC